MSITSITINHLNQLKELAENLTDDQLSETLPVLNNATIGQHIRHILEFYICLLECANFEYLNYDDRKRDKNIEVSTEKCLSIVKYLLKEMKKHQKDFEMTLYADYGTGQTNKAVSVKTSFFRELLYNIEHLVHHLAIVKIGLQSLEPIVKISDNFGIAASTIRNRKLCVQ
ncbi:MAG: DinB family protein [Flavobacteriaceae bacterium]